MFTRFYHKIHHTKNRRFSPISYRRKLANGKKVYRPWLIRSTIKDIWFCFKLFCQNRSFTLPYLTLQIRINSVEKYWKNYIFIWKEYFPFIKLSDLESTWLANIQRKNIWCLQPAEGQRGRRILAYSINKRKFVVLFGPVMNKHFHTKHQEIIVRYLEKNIQNKLLKLFIRSN